MRRMFTYIDPTVRERLVAAGKLFRIDREGSTVAPDQAPTGGATGWVPR